MTCLIGIDRATQSRKVGLARGYLEGGEVLACQYLRGGTDADPAQVVAGWLAGRISFRAACA